MRLEPGLDPTPGEPMGSAAERFSVSETAIGGLVGVAVAGELDAASCGRLVSALARVSDGHLRIVLDLGECTFLDSKGLDAILLAATRLGVQDRKLVICNARGPVRELLQLTVVEAFEGLILSGTWPTDG
jgi:anti-anti-sigma factor